MCDGVGLDHLQSTRCYCYDEKKWYSRRWGHLLGSPSPEECMEEAGQDAACRVRGSLLRRLE